MGFSPGSTCRPEAAPDVIHQQHLIIVGQDEVSRQMTRRSGRFGDPTQFRAAVDPGQYLSDLTRLNGVHRKDGGHLGADHLALHLPFSRVVHTNLALHTQPVDPQFDHIA